MTQCLAPDICVIGAGSAGLTVAAAAASFGVPVVLVEKDRMGGDCLNTGCVPSKALLAAARSAKAAGEGAHLGIRAAGIEADFPAVMAHVRAVIADIAPNDSEERFTGLGVTVLRGIARFKDRRTATVGSTEIRARRFVIATGSRAAVPPIPNISTVPYLTNETIFELKRRPAHLLVIGAGAIGLELAQAFRRLGSAVTVLEAARALPRDNSELTALLVEDLRADGVVLHEGAVVTRVARRGRNAIRVTYQRDGVTAQAEGTHLLVAAGRLPNVEDLGLAEAGIIVNERGISVDSRLRTRNRRVYAIGDVAGGPQFTHWAGYQAGLVVRSILFRSGGRVNPALLPWMTFTDPELAHVGMSEDEARRRHKHIEILRWPFSENDRAQTERATRGLVRVMTTRRGRILGVDILGRNAGDLIAPWIVAMSQGAKIRDLALAVFPYPTLSEASKRAAIAFYAPKLQSPLVARLIRVLRRFG